MTDTTQTLAEFLSHKSSVEGGLSDYLIELQDFLVEHPNPSDKQQDMFCAGVGEDFGSEPQIRAKALLEMEAERRAKVSVEALLTIKADAAKPAPIDPAWNPQMIAQGRARAEPSASEPEETDPISAALARLDRFADWPEWLTAAVAEADANPTLREGLLAEAERRQQAIQANAVEAEAELETESESEAELEATEVSPGLKNLLLTGGLVKLEEDGDEEAAAEGRIEPSRIETTKPSSSPPPALRREITLPFAASAAAQVQLLNQKHSVIGNYGGKCMVLSWERWDINPREMIPTFQSFGDFQNRYKNRYVQKQNEEGEVVKIPAGKFWLSAIARVTYDKVAFEPGEPEVLEGNRLNLWQGFAVTPRKGSWRLLRRHIYHVLGNGDRKAGRYILRWLAWAVQNPGLAAEAVLALQGEEGAGKGLLARIMLLIFGSASLPISDPNMLAGQFSGHLQHCCFLFVDEAFWAGDVKSEGRLKSLITEPTITIRPMYVQGFQVRNMLHIMMSSNNDWMVPAGHGSRRYAVFKVSDAHQGDFDYFNALNAEIDGGGTEAFLYDLLRLDLRGWHPKMVYETAALVEQKGHSLRGMDAWIEAMLQEGTLPKPMPNYPNRSLTDDLYESAKQFDRYTNKSKVAAKLKTVFGVDVMERFDNKVARGWAFPPLPEARQIWERRNGGSWQWHDISLTEWSPRALRPLSR